MTPESRTQVQTHLLDPVTPVSTGLRALVALADAIGERVTATWARQELDGHPADRLPDYRRVTAPIYGMAMRAGAPVYQRVDLADLPASHREEISRRHAALGLHQGVVTLERALVPQPEYALSPDPILHPDLPADVELIRLMPPRDDDLRFAKLYWAIKPDDVRGVLDAIRAAAETKVRALNLPDPAGSDETRKQTWWTKFSGLATAIGLVIALVAIAVTVAMG
ncbi:AbiTii domain-containing protein [Nucisporomicrobium flavum]|uniref:AbiTii domain-containing protein n=1 Tax=Nucisporomicrobium flavum TaxID=2785915 RepID=UPI0018F6FFD1|nr:hypothetical protein [Nucisporomicrobium flavum]